MKISTLLNFIDPSVPFPDVTIGGICDDSRRVFAGALFIALPGTRVDGAQYMDEAIAAGACAICCAGDTLSVETYKGVPLIRIPDITRHLGHIAAQYYHHPSQSLSIVGVTGTNGKSSLVYLLNAWFVSQQRQAAFIGTIGCGQVGAYETVGMTTLPAVPLQAQLATLRDAGMEVVTMEVSSHAVSQHRVAGIHFHDLFFTNLSQDHLDYHKTLEAYAEQKMQLFAYPGVQRIITNADDAWGRKLIQRYQDSHHVIAYGTEPMQHLGLPMVQATHATLDLTQTVIELNTSWGRTVVTSPLIGEGNLYNVLALCGYVLSHGISIEELPAAIAALPTVPGRMERFTAPQRPQVIIDYAHSDAALAMVLAFLRPRCHGKLVVVFGCGGERPVARRYGMGQVADQYADEIVLTEDNPRSEPVEQINAMILRDIQHPDKVRFIPDRAKAIEDAINACNADDVVLVSGKGHEPYQEKAGKRTPHSDVAVTTASLYRNQ